MFSHNSICMYKVFDELLHLHVNNCTLVDRYPSPIVKAIRIPLPFRLLLRIIMSPWMLHIAKRIAYSVYQQRFLPAFILPNTAPHCCCIVFSAIYLIWWMLIGIRAKNDNLKSIYADVSLSACYFFSPKFKFAKKVYTACPKLFALYETFLCV